MIYLFKQARLADRHFGAPGTIKITLEGDHKTAKIKQVLPESPAAKLPGLQVGMWISSINGKDVLGDSAKSCPLPFAESLPVPANTRRSSLPLVPCVLCVRD